VVIDHHEASVYDLRDGACVLIATLRPHDPHHFLHHLTHRDESRYRGQRAPEDPAFYDSLISALQGSEAAVLIGHATGASAAIDVLAQWLRSERGRAPQRIVEITHTDTSAHTLPELAQLAREALRTRVGESAG
jgi:predicted alpha/beta hydrolase family esterase